MRAKQQVGRVRTGGGESGSALVLTSPVTASDYQTAPRGTRRKRALHPSPRPGRDRSCPTAEEPRPSSLKGWCRSRGSVVWVSAGRRGCRGRGYCRPVVVVSGCGSWLVGCGVVATMSVWARSGGAALIPSPRHARCAGRWAAWCGARVTGGVNQSRGAAAVRCSEGRTASRPSQFPPAHSATAGRDRHLMCPSRIPL
jgi:hypothetical protein